MIQIFDQLGKIRSLSVECKAFLSDAVEKFSYKREETVFRSGNDCNYLYYITGGTLLCKNDSLTEEADTPKYTWVLVKDQIATCPESFFGNRKALHSIIAYEKTKGFKISKENAIKAKKFPEWMAIWDYLLSEYYAIHTIKSTYWINKDSKGLAMYIKQNDPEFLSLPGRLIAGHLGISRSTWQNMRSDIV